MRIPYPGSPFALYVDRRKHAFPPSPVIKSDSRVERMLHGKAITETCYSCGSERWCVISAVPNAWFDSIFKRPLLGPDEEVGIFCSPTFRWFVGSESATRFSKLSIEERHECMRLRSEAHTRRLVLPGGGRRSLLGVSHRCHKICTLKSRSNFNLFKTRTASSFRDFTEGKFKMQHLGD